VRVATALTRGELGLAAPEVGVEVHLGGGLPGLLIVGLAETTVKESRERVRAAIAQSGFNFPDRKITVNLAPAELPKAGGRFDLAVAAGVLAASGQVPVAALDRHEFLGELSFTGALRPVRGLLPALLGTRAAGRVAVVPAANAAEAVLVTGLEVRIADSLLAVARHLQDGERLPLLVPSPPTPAARSVDDLRDVQGQPQARRALEIAAAGGHNLLMAGPPGSGKSLLAHRLPGLLPPLTEAEAVETAAIASLAGVAVAGNWGLRPFRAPHHTASAPALVGGGKWPRPGEISLAHHGVLFLDEVAEFSRHVLEALREPLEVGRIAIARAARTLEFPARILLVCALNPCPCGYHGDPARECRCTPDQVRHYQERLSGPFLDRIDIRIEVPRTEIALHAADGGEPSAIVAARVAAARDCAIARQGVINARLAATGVRQWCMPDRAGVALVESAARSLQLSRRGCDSVLRVARTIADLARRGEVSRVDVAEALGLRRFPDRS
jgi:magnesium chelatase family protein